MVIFLHMTKTAGGALKEGLSKVDEGSILFKNLQPHDVSDSDKKEAQLKKMIFGHSTYGLHKALEVEPEYVVFLRNPVARTISHYYQLNNVEMGPLGDKIREFSDLDSFFASSYHWEFNNFMSRIITGVGAAEISDDDLKSLAIDRINKDFSFVGFFEFLPASVKAFSSEFKLSINDLPQINIGSYDAEKISKETINQINKLNEVDKYIYRYCLYHKLNKIMTNGY